MKCLRAELNLETKFVLFGPGNVTGQLGLNLEQKEEWEEYRALKKLGQLGG